MNKHWQDTMCPFCCMVNEKHAATCEWFIRSTRPQLTHRGIVIPRGVETVINQSEIVDYLNKQEQS